MVYELKKPITEEEKNNFIVLYNHNKNLQIVDTELFLFALENNEIMGEKEIEGEVIPYPVLNPDYPIIELNKAKEEKIKENDKERDFALIQGVSYKNILFDSDTDQKVNLLAIITTLGDEDVIEWYGMDNIALECTKEDLLNIGALITRLHSFVWTKNAQIKEEIESANTIEEVERIVIDYEYV